GAQPGRNARGHPVFDFVLDVVGRRSIFHAQLLHRSSELVLHGRKNRRLLRERRFKERQTKAESHRSGQSVQIPWAPYQNRLRTSCSGGAPRMGSPSCDCAFFCTSTSLTRSGGAEADTGTLPLSAPHMPLNTPDWSPAAINLLKAARGVPIR